MTSARKAKSNRVNAQASTGPKTAKGKSRAAQNARRHGLSLSILADPALAKGMDQLTHELAGEGAAPEIIDRARRVAEAQIDIARIRQARYNSYTRNLKDENYSPVVESRASFTRKRRILRRFVRQFGPTALMPPEMAEAVKCRVEGFKKSVFILTDLSKEVVAMDRYERRALSRRKFAIRALDHARQTMRRDKS